MNRIATSILGIVLFCLASCVKKDLSSSISDVVERRELLDGKRVLVHGFIEIDAMDYPNFVEERGSPGRERVIKSIDLLPYNESAREKIRKLGGSCIIVGGTLHVYRANEIRFGNLASMYGQIEARQIYECGGKHRN